MVSKVTGSLTIQVLLDRLPINHLIQLQQWEAVDVFGNHGLCGLLEEGGHEKSPKCLGGNLGDFGEFCKGLKPIFIVDTSSTPFSAEPFRLFYYERSGDAHYYLRSVGNDGKAFTADDILPNIKQTQSSKIGLLLQKEAQ